MSNIFLPPGLIDEEQQPGLEALYHSGNMGENCTALERAYDFTLFNIWQRSTYYLRRCMLYLMHTTSESRLFQYENKREYALFVLNLIDEELARRGK